MPQKGGGGPTTIVQPVGTQTRPTLLTRAFTGMRQVRFSQDDLQDPAQQHRIITSIVDNVQLALRPLSEDPTLSGNIVRGLVFTAGQTRSVPHGLGRAYTGFRVEHAVGAAPALYAVALPAGATSAQIIAIKSDNAGVFDVRVY